MATRISELSFVRRTHQLLSKRSLRARPPEFVPPVAEVLEPAIDGVLLLDTILERSPRFPFVSPLHLGTELVAFHATAMLGQGPTDVPEATPLGHVALLLCPHCVIGGCGGFSARMSRDARLTEWSDLGAGWPNLDHIGPFRFDTRQYESCLSALLDEAPARTANPINGRAS